MSLNLNSSYINIILFYNFVRFDRTSRNSIFKILFVKFNFKEVSPDFQKRKHIFLNYLYEYWIYPWKGKLNIFLVTRLFSCWIFVWGGWQIIFQWLTHNARQMNAEWTQHVTIGFHFASSFKNVGWKIFLRTSWNSWKIRKKIISFLDFLSSENQLQLNIVAINHTMCTNSINTPDRPPLPFIHNSSELNMNVCITLWRKGSICK